MPDFGLSKARNKQVINKETQSAKQRLRAQK
ncbi:Putative uncharacterized protein [Staphylococcus xylosus]|nr:Putative uncharacterized protein [Staphylococcus xylosus]